MIIKQKQKVMKNLKTSISPFIMLIIPVIFFIGLSLAFNVTEEDKGNDLSSVNVTAPVVEKVSIKTLVSLF